MLKQLKGILTPPAILFYGNCAGLKAGL